MSIDTQDRRRKNDISMRSIMDYGRGGIIFGVGLILLFASRMGWHKFDDLDPILRYGFAALCLLYGAFRIYRGYKKNHFSE